MSFKTKGMNRDLSVSAFNPEFSFENVNLRLSTNEGNTLLSWVNEKSTTPLEIVGDWTPVEETVTIKVEREVEPETEGEETTTDVETEETTVQKWYITGTPIGTAIINDKLVLFTHEEQQKGKPDIANPDYIYVLSWDKVDGKTILRGSLKFNGNLGFQVENPLETLVSYESEQIQKVYWVDGIHQTRFINIVPLMSKYYVDGNPINTSFDVSKEIELDEDVHVVKSYSSGGNEFPAGVIQYAFSYYSKNGAETAIFRTTPLQYITFADRGASPEEKVNVSFKIYGEGFDTNFDYLRIYSILRTSKDNVFVKRVQDIPMENLTKKPEGGSEETVIEIGPEIPYNKQAPFTLTLLHTGRTTRLEDLGGAYKITGTQKILAVPNGNSYYEYLIGITELKNQMCYALWYSEATNITFESKGSTVAYEWPEGAVADKRVADRTLLYVFPNGYDKFIPPTDDNDTWTVETYIEPCVMCVTQTGNHITIDGKTCPYGNPVVSRRVIPAPSTIPSQLIFIDTNSSGDVVDPTYLLYLGGTTQVYPSTLEQKNNKLFLGNLTIDNSLTFIDQEIKDGLKDTEGQDKPKLTDFMEWRPFSKIGIGETTWINTLCCPEDIYDAGTQIPAYYEGATAFKAHEYYRLGIQFQNKYGQWSEPCWVGDKQWDHYGSYIGPVYKDSGEMFSGSNSIGAELLPEFKYTITSALQSTLYGAGFRRMRAVYAVPSVKDRTILCQGVINSTLYRRCDRDDDFAYAHSSWLFRPKFDYANESKYNGFLDIDGIGNAGAVTPTGDLVSMFYWHQWIEDQAEDKQEGLSSNRTYPSGTYYIPEWEPWLWKNTSTVKDRAWLPYYRSTEIMGVFNEAWNDSGTTRYNYNKYAIDDKFGTVHSPDIEFSDYFASLDISLMSLEKVGEVHFDYTFGDINITTESDSIKPGKGFKKETIKTIGTSALISGNFYEDHIVTKADGSYGPVYRNASRSYLWPVFMWHRDGSLNNDVARTGQSARLKTKVIGNYRHSDTSTYTKSSQSIWKIPTSGMGYYGFTEAAQLIKVNGHIYKGCIDRVILPNEAGSHYPVGILRGDSDASNKIPGIGSDVDIDKVRNWVPKFTDLPVIKIHSNNINKAEEAKCAWALEQWENGKWHIYSNVGNKSTVEKIRWDTLGDDDGHEYANIASEDIQLTYHKSTVPIKFKSTPHLAVELSNNNISNLASVECLPIVEVYKEYNADALYGGTTDEALQGLTWIPCGPITKIDTSNAVDVYYKWGDTYFQRYECLKTYPYTPQDKNQVVEIGSFMLETRENIDGRYDKNRGYAMMLYASPQNFNLMNPVYSQQDNFFNYKIMPKDSTSNNYFPNQITWTLSKEAGADVDAWTNITLANTLDLDGDKGSLNKLIKFNDILLAFQDTGISRILYNENVQIASTEGVPIELANSGVVQGNKYISNTVGCSNKWSMTTTPSGIYFLDSYSKDLYLFNGELQNISSKAGFNSWFKTNMLGNSKVWNPKDFDNFVTYYDRLNQDVLLINDKTSLAFSEKVGNFTSFYDYGDTPYFCNLEDTGLWIRKDGTLWKHQGGTDYCKFFNEDKPYSMTLVGNPEPQTDKTFTNLEFRACVTGDMSNNTFLLPFDYLETWNEYQHGKAELGVKNGLQPGKHHTNDGKASLTRKFRMWRCDIPRDNAVISDAEAAMGISRSKAHPMDRMRNPWIYLKLQKNASDSGLPKIEVHDLVMTYYN